MQWNKNAGFIQLWRTE